MAQKKHDRPMSLGHWAGAFNVDVSLKSSARLIAIYRLPMELCLQMFGFERPKAN